MRFSLKIKSGNDTITPILQSMYSRTGVILEGEQCLVDGLKALGGTVQNDTPVDLFGDETIELT